MIAFLILWFSCGFLAFGACNGYFKNKFSYYVLDKITVFLYSCIYFLCGIIGFLIAMILSNWFENGFSWSFKDKK